MFDITQLTKDILFYFQRYSDTYSYLVPLGIIGIWRWTVWSMKEIVGSNYKPKMRRYRAGVSLVVPVYNEDPELFKTALASWVKEAPEEIIAVIDYSDKVCIDIFKDFTTKYKGATLIVTKKPGKRPALADGIRKATKEIIALVDSDTIWGEDVIKNGLPPFNDSKIAGVATYQSVLKPKTFAQKIFDVQLDLRYMHEYPFLAAAGDALVCLSGRTAFYRREILIPMLHDLEHEEFMGKPVISGDDKCLTYLVLAAGWKVAYQSNSHVYTPGMADLGSYLKQRLRWSRNSLRADLKALLNGWPRRHPALLFFQIDKVLQSFVIILSPIFFIIALVYREWLIAVIILIWWFVSRSIKMYSHLLQKPNHITILPGFILFSFLSGILKIYALFTLNTQGWITRWDKSRLPQLRFLNAIPAYIGTAVTVLILTFGVHTYKQYTYYHPHREKDKLISTALKPMSNNTLALNSSVLGASTEIKKDLLVSKYKTVEGDTIQTVAKRFNIDEKRIYLANSAKIPYANQLPIGITLSIPGSDINLDPLQSYPYSIDPFIERVIRYEQAENTIVVFGRGKTVTLHEIKEQVPTGLLEEIEPKIWHLKASLYINNGVTLELDKSEVTYLKLESNSNEFVMIRSMSGDILVNGVKITSWDSINRDYDKNIDDGRSFIMLKGTGRMDFIDAEAAYLGYSTSPQLSVSPYGVSWKITDEKLLKDLITGEVINSKFHHNYFGTYTFGATGMLWRDNEFYENVRYGLDPHDDSNGFLVEGNYAHNNGTHGIIFSKRCMYNTIRDNTSINNGLHGIMLHEKSDNNVIENNMISGNISGVALWRSSNNIIRNNHVQDNKHGIRANVNSLNNVIEGNSIIGSSSYGIYFYDNANNNIVQQNKLNSNKVALYIKSNSNQVRNNKLLSNEVGIYFLETASNNIAESNDISQSSVYAIYTKINENINNVLGNNTFERNRKDIEGQKFEDVGE